MTSKVKRELTYLIQLTQTRKSQLGTGHKVQGGGGPAKSVSVETVFC